MEDLQFLKVRFRVKHGSDWVKDFCIAESVLEAENIIKRSYPRQQAFEIISTTMMGKAIKNLEAGDVVELRSSGEVYSTEYVERTTKHHIFLKGKPQYKFRKQTGDCIGSEKWRWLRQYDQEEIDEREKAKVWRNKTKELQRVRWMSVKEETLNQIYELLKKDDIIAE